MTSQRQRRRTLPAAPALRRLASAAALLLTVIACAGSEPPPEQSATEALGMTAPVDARSLLTAMLNPAQEDAVTAALASLPLPLASTTRPVPNLHARGVTDQVDSLTFGDISIEVYRPGDGGRPLLSAVQLNTGAVSLDGLRVGMDSAALVERFGHPVAATDDEVVFHIAPSTTTPFELSASLESGRVTTLRWSAYLD